MPSWACSQRSFSRLISWSRPVSGVSPAGAAASIGLRGRRRRPRTRKSSTGWATPLIFRRPRLAHSKLALDQPVGGLGADDLAGRGDVLQPDGHVPGLPHQRDRVLLRLHDGRPGVEADPRIQLQLVFAAELLAEGLHVLEEAEAGLGGAACGVLVGHRVAEARQQPLLVALHDRPVEAAHRLLAGLLEGPQHLGLILRVEPPGTPRTRTGRSRRPGRSPGGARPRGRGAGTRTASRTAAVTRPSRAASDSPVGIDRGDVPG